MFSNNSSSYDSLYTEDNIKEAQLTLPVLPWELTWFCILQLHEILLFWRFGFLIILFCKKQHQYLYFYLKFRLLSKHFCLQLFIPKDSVSLLIA